MTSLTYSLLVCLSALVLLAIMMISNILNLRAHRNAIKDNETKV